MLILATSPIASFSISDKSSPAEPPAVAVAVSAPESADKSTPFNNALISSCDNMPSIELFLLPHN